MAVFPVDGGPANSMALPAILPSWIILRISPAAFRAFPCPTIPCEFSLGSSLSSRPSPRICEWAPVEHDYEFCVVEFQRGERTDPLHLRDVPQFCSTGGNLCRLNKMSTLCRKVVSCKHTDHVVVSVACQPSTTERDASIAKVYHSHGGFNVPSSLRCSGCELAFSSSINVLPYMRPSVDSQIQYGDTMLPKSSDRARSTTLSLVPPPSSKRTSRSLHPFDTFAAPINDHLYQGGPIKGLTIPRRKNGGRNNQGRITVRGRGGGHKQRIRTVDFMRSDRGPQDVIRIEYDPGRSAHIALVRSRNADANGGRRYSYILAPDGIRPGAIVESFRMGIPDGLVPGFVDSKKGNPTYSGETDGVAGNAEVLEGSASTASLALGLLRAATVKPGNVLPLRLIPPGTLIHCVSLFPERAGILVRSAGTFAQVVVHDDQGKYTQVKLQSGEVRKVLQDCCATIGKVSNPLWRGRVLGKAGRNRWLGRRPHVRGVAMNRYVVVHNLDNYWWFTELLLSLYRVDHPHGGGRGKSKGNKQPRSVWGWLTKGKRTRRPGPKGPKNSNKMVVRERPRGKEKRNL